MKPFFRRRPLAVLFTVALLPLTALTIFSPSYQTNDDVVMRLLAEGNFVPGTGPLPYLMFINAIIGKILVLLYQVTAAMPWYDLVLGGSMIAASIALVHVWTGTGRASEILWALVFAVYFLLPTFVSVQFSLAGLACSAAGMSLIVRATVANPEPQSRRRHLLLGIALFTWGSLIRFPGAVLMSIETVLLASAFVIGTLRNREERPRLRGVFAAAGVALLLAFVGFGIGQIAYRQAKGWKNFYEYNILRLRLAEYISPERITPAVREKLSKEVGWSANDFSLFSNWFFTDPDLFSLDRVRQAERLFYGEANQPQEGWRKARVERSLELGVAFFKETGLAFLVMGLFVLANGARPKLLLYFAGTALALGALVVGISVTLKAPPQRIYWPMLIMAATMLAMAAQRWGRPIPWPVNAVAVLVAAYAVVVSLLPLKRESDERGVAVNVARADVEGLRRTGATMFILHADAFPYESFWTPLHTEKVAFPFVGLGVSARTPPVQDFLAQTKRTDLPWSLCTEPGMVIVAASYVPPMLVTFVDEHRHTKVELVEAYKGKRILAWKCRRL